MIFSRRSGLVAGLILLVAVAAGWWKVSDRGRSSLVVYCTHDLVFAQSLVDQFTRNTGIPVEIVGDTEAAKSLGIVQRLERERDNPRCDVYWGNESLGTMHLASRGIFEPYESPEAINRPPQFRDPEHLWTGFGVRYRVWIVNTNKMPATEEAIAERMAGADLSRVAIAEPLYGTTLTQWSLEWKDRGPEEFQKWHRDLKARGVHFVKGNGAVRDLVAAGTCDFGMTDTDDFYAAVDNGAPVAMLPIRFRNQTIAIPNTVSLVKGSAHPEEAREFIDYLLSEEADLELARSGSRQAPVHVKIAPGALPDEIEVMVPWATGAASLAGMNPSRDECLTWLVREFAP